MFDMADLFIYFFTPDALPVTPPKAFVSPPKTEPGIFPVLSSCVNHQSKEPLVVKSDTEKRLKFQKLWNVFNLVYLNKKILYLQQFSEN